MISNCGHDERWAYRGGQAGDQTGTEWQLVPWYSYPWDVVLRYPAAGVRHWMGDQARKAALNNCIGYDQGQRMTFWNNLADSNYDAAQITVRCEADCSSGVLAIVKAAGYHFGIKSLQAINHWGYTGNEEAILTEAGFETLRAPMYTRSGNYLDNGDILLNTRNHTAFNVDKGALFGSDDPANIPSRPVNYLGIDYQAHCQTFGWLPVVHDGQIAGTVAESRRMEALRINPPEGVVLDVDVHMQGIGWKTYEGVKKGSNTVLGTTGQSRRLEAVRIRVKKNPIGKAIRLQCHCQTFGWMETVGEGAICGTTGLSKRMEAIRIWFE